MMGRKRNEQENEDIFYDTGELLQGASGEGFSLEDILAEYNRGTEAAIHREALRTQGDPVTEEVAEPPELSAELVQELMDHVPDLPPEVVRPKPRPVSVEEVVGRTVEGLLAEGEPVQDGKRRRGLFSRREMEETEEIYSPPPPKPAPKPAHLEPEPPLGQLAEEYRRLRVKLQRPLPWACLLSALGVGLMAVEQYNLEIPYWTENLVMQTAVLLGLLVAVSLLCLPVFTRGVRALGRKRCTPELLVSLSALVGMGDCVGRFLLTERCEALPFAVVNCTALCFALWGQQQEAVGFYDAYRTAALNDTPPFRVADLPQGACKQRGNHQGYFYMSEGESLYARQLTMLLPVILTATVVFALLTSLGQGRTQNFLWCWSAILAGAASFALPLTYSLPFSRLARRLQKAGAAIAGYAGAERICRKKGIILTDSDFFPPGAITLNGMKIFGEDLNKVVTYAASMARTSGSGLVRLFDGLMQSEGGRAQSVDEFSFYEEGGVSGTICGEAVLMGTYSFMRKMEIRLPSNINLKTGVFLTVDRQLVAVFATKYLVSENVEWALRSLRRGRILPILAVRDGNITPDLIKRKFKLRGKLAYPDLSTRLALSEQGEGEGPPDALLFREGLLPYAEVVTGSRRYSRAARVCTTLGILGSVAGTLLTAYLSLSAAYTLLTPLALLVFLLLWTLPVLLLSGWVKRF